MGNALHFYFATGSRRVGVGLLIGQFQMENSELSEIHQGFRGQQRNTVIMSGGLGAEILRGSRSASVAEVRTGHAHKPPTQYGGMDSEPAPADRNLDDVHTGFADQRVGNPTKLS
jgi:hypothetical protein